MLASSWQSRPAGLSMRLTDADSEWLAPLRAKYHTSTPHLTRRELERIAVGAAVSYLDAGPHLTVPEHQLAGMMGAVIEALHEWAGLPMGND